MIEDIMRIAFFPPAQDLARLVAGYCLCDDPSGVMAGQSVTACPQLQSVICLQLADDVDTDFRDRRPVMSYAGLQPGPRGYRPAGAARSLLIFLTDLGALRLFPHVGPDIFAEGHDMGGLIGDGPVIRARTAASAADNDRDLTDSLDTWLRERFAAAPAPGVDRVAAAMAHLGPGAMTVAQSAGAVDLSERQLERAFQAHIGITPKGYQQLFRLNRSLTAALSGEGDPLDGFSDQAHQIRTWKTHLGATPGAIGRQGLSPVGRMFLSEARAGGQVRTHYF